MRTPCCAVLILAAAGCGDADYRADFTQNTVPYYAQRQRVDAALSGVWENGGIQLRVPKSFSEVSPPPSPTKEQREDEYFVPPKDPRQPDYLLAGRSDPGRLPGLRGAWKMQPRAGQAGERWLYVLDSTALKNDPEEPGLDPEKFVDTVADRFARSMKKDGRILSTPTEYKTKTYPQSQEPFAPPVQYKTPQTRLSGRFSDDDGAAEHRVELYVHERGSRTIMVILVMPEGGETGQSLREPTDLMLQTLVVGDAARSRGPAGGGRPSGGAGF